IASSKSATARSKSPFARYARPRLLKYDASSFWERLSPDRIAAVQPSICRSTEKARLLFSHHSILLLSLSNRRRSHRPRQHECGGDASPRQHKAKRNGGTNSDCAIAHFRRPDDCSWSCLDEHPRWFPPSIQRAIQRNRVLQRRAVRVEATGATHARDQRDVEKLLHVALEAHPFDDVAVPDVDDEQATPRHGFSLGELIVERQALKTSVARQ